MILAFAKTGQAVPGNCKEGIMLMKFRSSLVSILALAFSLFGLPAHAVGPDMTTVTSAVDFGTVTTAVLGVAASLIVVYIAWKGAKMVIAAVRGG